MPKNGVIGNPGLGVELSGDGLGDIMIPPVSEGGGVRIRGRLLVKVISYLSATMYPLQCSVPHPPHYCTIATPRHLGAPPLWGVVIRGASPLWGVINTLTTP